MAVPDHIFIDTCIFEQAGFNFNSAKLKPFRDALESLNLTFVDPDPIFRERIRHLRNRVDEAMRSLEKIEKSLPIITTLDKWPKASYVRDWQMRRVVNKSLAGFLKPMKHVKLGYDGIDIHKVMTWYEQNKAPFGQGKKKKEFPDAFAVAILDHYAQSNKCEIAIVSTDKDFERVCAERTDLLYFPSLAAYLQVRQGESERVKLVQTWFENNPGVFDERVADAFYEIDFEIEEGWDGEISDAQVDEVNITDFYVVAVADKECTVSFEAEINFSANVNYENEDAFEYDLDGEPLGCPREESAVSSTDYTSVLAKVKLDNTASKVEEIIYLDLDIVSTSVSVAASVTY
jgi:predicted nucleic acid-binding protein